MVSDKFLYKRQVNKSVLWDGFGIEREYLDVFIGQIGPMERGQKRAINLFFEGQAYGAEIKNLNNAPERRRNDAYQIRYPANGEFAKALQKVFHKTYSYIQESRKIESRSEEKKRIFTAIPEEYKEYVAIYTTNDPATFICEPILADDLSVLRTLASKHCERVFESEFNYDVKDDTTGINTKLAVKRYRKLNKKIGDTLKEHYHYKCQICGQWIGEKYGSHLVEAHHIDYFVKSLNNDMGNLLIVCPNHHAIIHDTNPQFNRKTCIYTYPNGYKEGLVLNDHL